MLKRIALALFCLVMISALAVVYLRHSKQSYPMPVVHPTLLWEKTVGPARSMVRVHFSRDGRYLATGSKGDSISFWEPGTGGLVRSLRAPGGSSWSIAFSPDSRYVATCGSISQVLEVRTGKPTLKLPADVTSVSFSPGGKLLAGSGDRVTIWDMSTGKIVRRLGRTDDIESSAVFSPQGGPLAYGDPYLSNDEYIYQTRLYDVRQGKVTHTLAGAGGRVAFSPDGAVVAAGTQGAKVVRMWNVQTGKRLRAFVDWRKIGSPCAEAFSPDGKLIAVGGTAKPVPPEPLIPALRRPTPSGLVGGAITISDACTGRILWQRKVSIMDRVVSVDFSPDGKLLAAGVAWDAKVMVWRIR